MGGHTTMEQEIGYLLKSLGLTLATAESATGGRIADHITNVSGSSEYFLGGVVAYDNRVKTQLLGVSEETLKKFGAVSPQTAEAMAAGVKILLGAHIGVSTTGIAGPSGATPKKPVGLVYIGISSKHGTHSHRFLAQGSREENKAAFTQAALQLLKETLAKWKPQPPGSRPA
ncbi:MAG: CinA family protein [Chloroflexi bacterium]|nr:CinA family protein [Chloroflexota bacterium]